MNMIIPPLAPGADPWMAYFDINLSSNDGCNLNYQLRMAVYMEEYPDYATSVGW